MVWSRNRTASCVISQLSSLPHGSLDLANVPSYETSPSESVSSLSACFKRSTKYLPAIESSSNCPRTITLSPSKQNFPTFVQNVFVPTFSVILTLCLFRLKTLFALRVTVHHRVLDEGCDSLGNKRILTVTFFLLSPRRLCDMLSPLFQDISSLVDSVEWFGLDP